MSNENDWQVTHEARKRLAALSYERRVKRAMWKLRWAELKRAVRVWLT